MVNLLKRLNPTGCFHEKIFIIPVFSLFCIFIILLWQRGKFIFPKLKIFQFSKEVFQYCEYKTELQADFPYQNLSDDYDSLKDYSVSENNQEAFFLYEAQSVSEKNEDSLFVNPGHMQEQYSYTIIK